MKKIKLHKFVIWIIIFSLVITLLSEIINKRWDYIFITALSIVLCFIPFFFQKKYNIYLPSEIQIITVLFIYAGLFLGEVRSYFTIYWWWDSLLHLTSGFVIALIIFGIMYVLYKTQKLSTTPFFIMLIVFCMTLAIGAIWEIFEYTVDEYYNGNMQKAKNLCPKEAICDSRIGVKDTMKDLILDSAGALVISFAGYFYLKKGNNFLLNKIMKKFENNNTKLFYK